MFAVLHAHPTHKHCRHNNRSLQACFYLRVQEVDIIEEFWRIVFKFCGLGERRN